MCKPHLSAPQGVGCHAFDWLNEWLQNLPQRDRALHLLVLLSVGRQTAVTNKWKYLPDTLAAYYETSFLGVEPGAKYTGNQKSTECVFALQTDE